MIWLAVYVSCQSRSSPVGDLRLVSSQVKSFPFIVFFASLCRSLVLLFIYLFIFSEKSELACGFQNAAASWMYVLMFSVLFWFLWFAC